MVISGVKFCTQVEEHHDGKVPLRLGRERVTGDLGRASFWEVAWVRAALDRVQGVFTEERIWCTLGVGEEGQGTLRAWVHFWRPGLQDTRGPPDTGFCTLAGNKEAARAPSTPLMSLLVLRCRESLGDTDPAVEVSRFCLQRLGVVRKLF